MEPTIIVALISFSGTLIGSVAGVLTGTKLSNYRIQKLEERVKEHNGIVERTYKLEGAVTELQHDVRDIKSGMNKEK